MERRHFLNFTVALIAGAAALAGNAQAAPLAPISAQQLMQISPGDAESAVVSQDEIDRIKPEQVRWGHHGHGHHWGWHHHRHWGLATPPLASPALGMASPSLAPPALASSSLVVTGSASFRRLRLARG